MLLSSLPLHNKVPLPGFRVQSVTLKILPAFVRCLLPKPLYHFSVFIIPPFYFCVTNYYQNLPT